MDHKKSRQHQQQSAKIGKIVFATDFAYEELQASRMQNKLLQYFDLDL